jgi:Nif-specific regulatory protein
MPTAPIADPYPTDAHWREQELLLMREVMKWVGRSLGSHEVLREMLHLMSELLGLNRGRIVLRDTPAAGAALGPATASIRHAYGLTGMEIRRGVYAQGDGITGRVLQTGLPAIVQDIAHEPLFLFRSVASEQFPAETVAYLALPITLGNTTVGVLGCHRIRSRQRHLNDDLAVLKVLATLAGQVLHMEQLVNEQTRHLRARNAALSQALSTHAARYGLIGSSPALLQALSELERVSQSQATVLLLGESGTGKELFARAVHLASPRSTQPFIKVNCSAIPDTLFESELFGHERGAFTGAHQARPGWFEQAHGGTIFLDEIGELPLPLQSKLLRTLQEGAVVRLGSQREVKVDVRLVAATNRDLAAQVQAGHFRQDLYYRLNVIPIRLPSLAERPGDIRELALHFVNRANQTHQKNVYLSPEALDMLTQQPWPGNIRELGNCIERMVLLADQTLLTPGQLQPYLPQASTTPARTAAVAKPADAMADAPWPPVQPAASERTGTAPLGVRPYESAHSHTVQVLQHALEQHQGNQSRAAQSLGLTLRQFAYRLRKAGLR